MKKRLTKLTLLAAAFLLPLIPMSATYAGAMNAATKAPIVLQAVQEVRLSVKGASNQGVKNGVEAIENELVSKISQQLENQEIRVLSSEQAKGRELPHLVVAFRLTSEGPQYNGQVWVELYDQVVHVASDQPVDAQLWGINQVVVTQSSYERTQAIENQVAKDLYQLIALIRQGQNS